MSKKIRILKRKLKDLYINKKLSTYNISRLYNCDPTVIQNRLREYKINLRKPKQKKDIKNKDLIDLYLNKKLSTYNIAKLYNCKANTILRHLNKYCGISARPLKIVYISKKELLDLYINKRFPLSKIAKLYYCSSSIILNKLKKYDIKRRDKFESNMKYERRPFDGGIIKKAYLIGFRLGDLNVKKVSERTIKIKSSTTRIEQVNLIKSLFSEYGYVYSKKGNFCYNNECALDTSFDFLLEKKDEIKDWILKDDKSFFAFLGGYTDAEGNIGVYTKRARYRVGSYDRVILSQTYKKLNKLGIRATYSLETKKGIHGNRKHNGDFWRVKVSERYSLLRLLNNIEPFIKHEKRYKDLVKAKNNLIERMNRNEKVLHNNPNLLCE